MTSTTTTAHLPRIACLIPSATDICIALGLQDQIVGITHECAATSSARLSHARILTRDGLLAAENQQHKDSQQQQQSQRKIHLQVQQQQQQALQCSAAATAAASNTTTTTTANHPPLPASLYPIVPEKFYAAQADIVLTQDLCHVCAPSKAQVQSLLLEQQGGNENEIKREIQIISLTPHTLQDVLDSIVTVADACGVHVVAERGRHLRDALQQQLQRIHKAISEVLQNKPKKKVLLLEWLDPPFDGGHWILDMMECAGCVNVLQHDGTGATSSTTSTTTTTTTAEAPVRKKSMCRTWSEIQNLCCNSNSSSSGCHQPDIVWIASCGRTLEQNVRDCHAMATELIQTNAARIVALNGDAHFARPGGPNLVLGVAIMAWTAYQDEPSILSALAEVFPALNDSPENLYQVLDPSTLRDAATKNNINNIVPDAVHDLIPPSAPDVEDCMCTGATTTPWDQLHEEACQAGLMSYKDPDTGYSVFTALAHQKRGRCCGSGCRHCPFSHENVKDKASRIQQPAFLYTGAHDDNDAHASCPVFCPLHRAESVKVLFFSGGKDSFLTIRALVRHQREQEQQNQQRQALVLLTTFDATSRIIAHQEVDIESVLHQAKHLELPLVGVPQHRGTSLSYVGRIQQGLQVIKDYLQRHGNENAKITSLVFGDLHLQHIRDWRQDQLGPLGYELLFPLWKADYRQLEQDLEASCVPCVVSNSTVDTVRTGEVYDAKLRQRLQEYNDRKANGESTSLDLFGEKGEFHTLARVWEVNPSVALGWEGSTTG